MSLREVAEGHRNRRQSFRMGPETVDQVPMTVGQEQALLIVPAVEFWSAEGYHQAYLDKHPEGYTCHWMRE